MEFLLCVVCSFLGQSGTIICDLQRIIGCTRYILQNVSRVVDSSLLTFQLVNLSTIVSFSNPNCKTIDHAQFQPFTDENMNKGFYWLAHFLAINLPQFIDKGLRF